MHYFVEKLMEIANLYNLLGIINENDTEKEASIRCVLKSGSFSLLLLPKPKGI
jgi:hypothetical protein